MGQACSTDIFGEEGLICSYKFFDIFMDFTIVEEQCV
jgi:hypothetical protein